MAQSKERHAEYSLEQYRLRRAEAIELLGGKCVVCEQTIDLELDHIDPTTKSFSIGSLWSISKERYLEELAKCQLLCSKHHLEKTRKEQSVEHGQGKWGKRHCPCDLCAAKRKEAWAEYSKTYTRKRDRR